MTIEATRTRLAEVFEREKARFLGFVRRQLGPGADLDVEDVVADVAFRLLLRADLVAEVESLTTYIYRSLINRVEDHRRGHRRMETVDPTDPDDPERGVSVPHDGPGPEEAYGQAQLRARLRSALDQLSPKERAIWIATEIHGCSFRDLTETWGEPIGTLLSRKSRATAHLRQLLSEYEPESGRTP